MKLKYWVLSIVVLIIVFLLANRIEVMCEGFTPWLGVYRVCENK